MRIVSFLILLAAFSGLRSVEAQVIPKTERMQWWREARFGMFIHWGVYAQWAGVYNGHEQRKGGAEWILNRSKIPVAEYREKAREFNPVNYNPDEWVRMAKDAGMKYIVITAKHHDGFALFKSTASDWNVVDATTYGKDLLKPLAKACKKYGMPLGFYYSQAQDWTNPGGAVSRKPASDGWLHPDSAKIDAYTKEHNGHWDPIQDTRSFSDYIHQVAAPQVKELLSNYGKIAVLWWDTPTNMTKEAALELQSLLALQPAIITNDRLKKPDFPGDTKTPEQKIPGLHEMDTTDWETCMTMNGTWGYRTSDTIWKSTTTLIRNLSDIASKGGNYLLNVGPKADGSFPEASVRILKEMGLWMKVNGVAIYGTLPTAIPQPEWGRLTQKKEKDGSNHLFLHLFSWPPNRQVMIPFTENKRVSVHMLANNQQLSYRFSDSHLIIDLPETEPDKILSVIQVSYPDADKQ